jgi:hypothetical protein
MAPAQQQVRHAADAFAVHRPMSANHPLREAKLRGGFRPREAAAKREKTASA